MAWCIVDRITHVYHFALDVCCLCFFSRVVSDSALQILLCPAEDVQQRTAFSTTLSETEDTHNSSTSEQTAAGTICCTRSVQNVLETNESTGKGLFESDSVGVSKTDDVTISSLLQGNIEDNILSRPYLVKVPAYAPLTRKQYEETILYWPVTFHEDKRFVYLILLLCLH